MRKIFAILFATLVCLTPADSAQFDTNRSYGYRYHVTFEITDPLDGPLTVHVYTNTWIRAGGETWMGNPNPDLLSPNSGDMDILILNGDCFLNVGSGFEALVRPDGNLFNRRNHQGLFGIGIIPVKIHDFEHPQNDMEFTDRNCVRN